MTFLPPRIKRASAERRCLACDSVLVKRLNERSNDFKRRDTCNRTCGNRASRPWQTVGEMLVQKTMVSKLTGCWEWIGCRDKAGYGRTEYRGEVLAHRIAYADRYGPIPDGMHVLHRCDNPACCNVEHLSLGTHAENMADMVRKGRSASGKRSGSYKHGRSARPAPIAENKAYWDWLPKVCVCGAQSEHIHHIIHVNGQRITKDHWLVVPLCHACHNGGDQSVHALGGERQFLQATGWDLVQLAVLHRHNFEMQFRSPHRHKLEQPDG